MRPIWYFQNDRRWWMETSDAHVNRYVLNARIDGIRVMNPETLPSSFIANLEHESNQPIDQALLFPQPLPRNWGDDTEEIGATVRPHADADE